MSIRQDDPNRIITAAEAAKLFNCSIRHWRQLYKDRKVPPPVRLSTRKIGWKYKTLVDFAEQRAG